MSKMIEDLKIVESKYVAPNKVIILGNSAYGIDLGWKPLVSFWFRKFIHALLKIVNRVFNYKIWAKGNVPEVLR